MTTINHWGKWIDTNTPTTGVLSIHDVNFEYIDDEICITCESAYNEIDNDDTIEDKESEYEYIECDSSHTRLLGDWIKDDKGMYNYDPNGEFAAIENESTIQVVYSKYITNHCKPCSPCYPGQLDINYDYNNTEWQAYTLPDYLLRKDK